MFKNIVKMIFVVVEDIKKIYKDEEVLNTIVIF